MNESIDIVDVAVIGAGPAGLMAAVQAVRQGLTVALFEKDRPGGQALAANLIENFPGLTVGVAGPELMQRFLKQVDDHGICITPEVVTRIHRIHLPSPLEACPAEARGEGKGEGETNHSFHPPLNPLPSREGKRDYKTSSIIADGFAVKTDRGRCDARSIIVASGLAPKRLGVPGEEELVGRRIFSYADPSTIDHAGKDIIVIGAGDAAFDQAMNFAKRACDVTIAMRGSEPTCAPLLFRRARDIGISFLFSKVVKSFAEVDDSILISFEDGAFLKTDIAITCIGKTTNFEFLDEDLRVDIMKFSPSPTPLPSRPALRRPGEGAWGRGLFFAGDCRRGKDRHIAIACGDGIEAAMKAAEYLK